MIQLRPGGLTEFKTSFALLLFSSYSLIATASGWLASQEHFAWPSVYFSALIVFLFLGAFLGRRKVFPLSARYLPSGLDKSKLLYLGIGCFFVGVFWIPRQYLFSPWFDETTQFFLSIYPSDNYRITQFAAIQQQPPLDYFFSQFSRHLLGSSLFSMRFHTGLFSLLSVFSVCLFAAKRSIGFSIFALWLGFFLNQSEHAQYSIEARPLALGIFLSIWVFQTFVEWIDGKEELWFELIAWSTFLVVSLGYQSCFFLLLMPLAFFLENVGRQRKAMFFVTFIPGLLCFPIWLNIYLVSIGEQQFHLDRSIFNAIEFFQNNLAPYGLMFWESGKEFVFVSAFFFLCFLSKPQKFLKAFLPILIFGVAFPILVILSWYWINWGLWPKYFVIWITGLFLIVLKNSTIQKHSIFHIPLLLVCLLYFSISFLPEQKKRLRSQFLEHPNFLPISGYLEKRAGENLAFYYASLQETKNAKFDFLTARLFSNEKHIWLYRCFQEDKICQEPKLPVSAAGNRKYLLFLELDKKNAFEGLHKILSNPRADYRFLSNPKFLNETQSVFEFTSLNELEVFLKTIDQIKI